MRLRQLVANRGFWAWGLFAFGVVSTGLMWGCVRLAVPDRPISREWWPAVLLVVPYLLAAVSLGINQVGSVFGFFYVNLDVLLLWVAAGVVLLCGLVFLACVVADFGPVLLKGTSPPAVPGSLHVVAFGLFVQYPAALAMLLHRVFFR